VFSLRFKRGTVRYTILADCAGCGTSRRVSLDAAHAGAKRSKKHVKKAKRRSKRQSAALLPITRQNTRPRESELTSISDRFPRRTVQLRLFPP
jgi:hypothetical protein